MVTDASSIADIYGFKPHFMKIKDFSYHYVDEGSGDPVVMLHGNPTWSFLFRNLIRPVSAANRVIAPDHLGCGLSDKPLDFPYRLETHIDNLEQLVHTLNLENITLLVHDWGGPIGMGFATRYPEKIRRLIITNTAAFTSRWIPMRIEVCRIPWLGRKIILDWNLFCKAACHMTTVKKMPENVRRGYLLPYDTPESRIAVHRFVQDIPLDYCDQSYELMVGMEDGLWMFRELPVLILWGMKDWCFTPKFLARWQEFLPDANIVRLMNAGHYLFEDAPDEIAASVVSFLKE